MRFVVPAERALALAFAVVLFACKTDTLDDRNELVLLQLEASERTWQRANIRDYSLVISRVCVGCEVQVGAPVRVEVANGVVTGRFLTTTGAPIPDAARPLFPNVDGLFMQIRQSIVQPWRTMQALYDPELGYPTRFHIDLDLTNATEDLSITVSDFTRH